MSKNNKTLTYQEAYNKLKEAGKPIKFGVDNNAENYGGYNEIYFALDEDNNLSSYSCDTNHDPNKDGIDYEAVNAWQYKYTGKFYDLESLDTEPEPDNQKIKSITMIKKFPFYTTWNLELNKTYGWLDLMKNSTWDIKAFTIAESFPDFFEIEYEKPKLLKRPDGSLISEPEEGSETVFLITHYYQLEKIVYAKYLYQDFKKGLIFLPEDKHLAAKKAKMLKKQLEIRYEIDRLNAEEDSSSEHKKVLCHNIETDTIYLDWSSYQTKPKQEISKKTAETILAKYSQDELKQYLGIIN